VDHGISIALRKLGLTAHVTASVEWLGAIVAFPGAGHHLTAALVCIAGTLIILFGRR